MSFVASLNRLSALSSLGTGMETMSTSTPKAELVSIAFRL